MRQTQRLAQGMHDFISIDCLVKLYTLYLTVLDPTKPLAIVDPSRPASNFDKVIGTNDGREENIHVHLEATALKPATTKVRNLLRTAMNNRFYNRYHPIKSLKNWKRVYGEKMDFRADKVTVETV